MQAKGGSALEKLECREENEKDSQIVGWTRRKREILEGVVTHERVVPTTSSL